MKKENKNKLLKEISKLKEDKILLFKHESITNNLIAHLLFLKYKSEAFDKEQQLFIAKMNHELRTPLNSLLGFAQLLDDECFINTKNGKSKEYIKNILLSGQMLLSLIDNLLDFSRLEMSSEKLFESKVDLLNILNDSICLIKKAIPFENKKISLHFSSSIDFLGDERMLRQIFLNILSNAVKFTDSKGRIDIYFKKLSTGIRFIFKDNGCGIKKENLPYIFNPFYQIQKSSDKYQQGMGLGLVLVKKMVILHQGNVHIKSVFKKGTVLMIDFPKERLIFDGR